MADDSALSIASPETTVPSAAPRAGRRRDVPRPERLHRNAAKAAGRRFWLVLAVTGLALLAGAFWAGTLATSPAALERRYAPAPRTVLTVPVVLRHLSEAVPIRGVVAAASAYRVDLGSVSVPGAQPIVTHKELHAGSLATNGTQLTEIAGRPIFAMRGTTPMYRDLVAGDRGPDVAQLQDDLAALGFASGDSPGYFGRGTEASVAAFYRHAGYAAATAGAGRKKAVVVPQAEVVFVPRLPAVVQSSSLALGQPVANPALVLTGGRLSAVVPLTTAQAALIRPGDRARLYISAAGGPATEVTATVTAVQRHWPKAKSGPAALLRPGRPLAQALLGDRLTAAITVADTRTAVLAVPVAALYTTASGQTIVTVVTGGRRIAVPVRVGAETGGYVPVQPLRGKLSAGDRVLVGQ